MVGPDSTLAAVSPMHASAEALVDRIIPVVRARLPAALTPAYFDGFARRNHTALAD